jgi:hypothetical protein
MTKRPLLILALFLLFPTGSFGARSPVLDAMEQELNRSTRNLSALQPVPVYFLQYEVTEERTWGTVGKINPKSPRPLQRPSRNYPSGQPMMPRRIAGSAGWPARGGGCHRPWQAGTRTEECDSAKRERPWSAT